MCYLPFSAYAQTEQVPPYVRIENTNVYFYSAPDNTSKLFALIPTYYLTVVGISGGFYQVELLNEQANFAKLNGYVLIDSVQEVYEKPLIPLYPKVLIQAGNHGCKIYPSPNEALTAFVTAVSGQSMSYYGKAITQYNEWYYVYFQGYLGYCQATAVTVPVFSLHPTPLTQPAVVIIDEPDTPATNTDQTDSNSILSADLSNPVQATLILLITLPLLVILAVVFIPTRKRAIKDKSSIDRYGVSTDTTTNQPRYFDDYL